jgi:translocator protein
MTAYAPGREHVPSTRDPPRAAGGGRRSDLPPGIGRFFRIPVEHLEGTPMVRYAADHFHAPERGSRHGPEAPDLRRRTRRRSGRARRSRVPERRLDVRTPRQARWAPPSSAFGPVWTALYAGIAVAGWRVYDVSPRARRLHLAQLALNAAWPGTFFGARDKSASLAVIALLDAAVTAEIATLRGEDRLAAALLTPYLGWCGFATALNASVSEPA